MASRETFKKITTSAELIEKVNPENKKLAEKFLRAKNSRSSELTVDNYRSDLNIFFVWNYQYNNNKFFIDIKKVELSEFFIWATEELKWGSSRFARMKSSLSSLSNYIERTLDEEYPNFRNIVLKAVENMPKNTVREKTVLTEEQINGVLEHFSNLGEHQLVCWFALSISSGSRFSELLRFTTDIINENSTAFNGIFLETTKAIKTKGRGKSGKLLKKYIIKDMFLPYYNTWMKIRQSTLERVDKKHNFLFIKSDGNPAKAGVVRGWVNQIGEYLNMPYYPHCSRHFVVTYLSKKGIPHQLIKELMGWASIELVEVYDDTPITDKSYPELEKLKKI